MSRLLLQNLQINMINFPINAIILDTGPLFAILYLHAQSNRYDRLPEPEKNKILDKAFPLPKDRNYLIKEPGTKKGKYLTFFDSIKTIITTSHVIGELKRHADKAIASLPKELKIAELEQFWDSSVEFLKKKNFDECLIRLLSDIYDDSHKLGIEKKLLPIIGPVDFGLISLALRNMNYTFFTFDEILLEKAKKQGISYYIQLEDILLQ